MSSDFWAGYISGAAGIIIGNPLDLIKTRLQAGQVQDAHPTSLTSLRSTFESAGTLVKGSTAPILGYGALNALLFVTFNRSLALLHGDAGTVDYLKIYVAGALGGLATFVVSTPTELIKVKAQLVREGTTSPTGPRARTTSLSIAKEIWKREGLRGLYLGGPVTAWRDAVGYGFYFCSYDFSKRIMASGDDSQGKNLSQWKIMLCGGIAGIVTWASIFPLDVIKTRLQSQSLKAAVQHPTNVPPTLAASQDSLINNHATSYGASNQSTLSSSSATQQQSRNESTNRRRSTLAITLSMYRNEGLGVFFRGLGICSVRAFIVNAVQWAVYEWMMVILSPKQAN